MPARVLIVDDYPKAAEALAGWVQRSGTEIRIALDGLQALATAEEFIPDLMLIDIDLPKLNGYEVARRIRQQPWGKQIALIAISGWISHEDRARAHAAGFSSVLMKPFNRAHLASVIAKYSQASPAPTKVN